MTLFNRPGRRGKVAPFVVAAAAGSLLAACAGDIPYATLEAKYDTAPSSWFDTPGGLHVRHRDVGPRGAPVLVMVHGFAASLDAWTPWTAKLSGDYWIVTLDLPGHGLTRAPSAWRPSIDAYADLTDALAGH